MPLTSGTKLGPYEILAPHDAGGMGEVYRARDTRLDRVVAIKILPSRFSADAVHKQRFEREAKVISRLNHPHICVLYDVGQQDGIDYLVMEFLEGETLAKRLEKGPLPLEQVLKLGAQVAEALDKAHRNGIAHRDLKPGNIMLTASGAKLLDFGLAKPVAPLGNVATVTAPKQDSPVTEQGAIVGTFQYMSPEQLEGKELDGRSDIFSLGAVLYEMVTGKRAFEGKSRLSIASAILEKEPPPISSIKPLTPPALDRVVKKCLAKDPEERWQSAHDLKDELKWIAEGGLQAGVAATSLIRRKSHERLAWIMAFIVLFLAVLPFVVAYIRRAPVEVRARRFMVPPPERAAFSTGSIPAISPDGRYLAFAAASEGKTLLWVRPLDSLSAQPLPGTEGATSPFWSPDSRVIGFLAQRKLKKIEISGGPAHTLCDVAGEEYEFSGATWNRDGVILLAPRFEDVIYRLSASGGMAIPVTALDSSRHEGAHRWPQFLPDGRHFLYLALFEDYGINVGSLDSKETKRILNTDSNVVYAPPGHLLYVREGTLLAQQFDTKRFEVVGDPFPVAQQVRRRKAINCWSFSVSHSNELAYESGVSNSRLIWFDRGGKQLDSVGEPGEYWDLELSPDNKRVVVELIDHRTNNPDIWIFDLFRGTPTRFTFDPGWDFQPAWSPDGSHIVYSTDNGNQIQKKMANGTGNAEALIKSPQVAVTDWSGDGRFIVYEQFDPKTRSDLWLLPLFGDRKPFPFLQTEFGEYSGRISPNGRWMAYTSDEVGRYEVYVQSFPAAGGKRHISTHGGLFPI